MNPVHALALLQAEWDRQAAIDAEAMALPRPSRRSYAQDAIACLVLLIIGIFLAAALP